MQAERKSWHLLRAFAKPACSDLQNAGWSHFKCWYFSGTLLCIQSIPQVTNVCQCIFFLDDLAEALEEGWVSERDDHLHSGLHSILAVWSWNTWIHLSFLRKSHPNGVASMLRVLQKQKRGKRQCIGLEPGILAASLKWTWTRSISARTHKSISWSMSWCSHEYHCTKYLQTQSTGALQLWIIASAGTNTSLFVDLVPLAHLLNSQGLLSRFPHPVRESSGSLYSRPKASIISWAACANAVATFFHSKIFNGCK